MGVIHAPCKPTRELAVSFLHNVTHTIKSYTKSTHI